MEVGAAQPGELRVEIREDTTLQQRIVAEVDARNDVGDAKRDLLGLREEIIGISVEGHLADAPHGHQLFGDQLRRVENVEIEAVGLRVVKRLDS